MKTIPSFANFTLSTLGDGRGMFKSLQSLGIIVRPTRGYWLAEWMRISVGTPKGSSHCVEALKSNLGR